MENPYNVPEVKNCCGLISLRFGTLLISILAIASGCFSLSSIVIYGLAEKNIPSYFIGRQINEVVRRQVIVTFVLASSLQIFAGCLSLLGALRRGRTATASSICVMTAMCFLILVSVVRAPISCFFTSVCIMKDLSPVFLTLCYIIVTVFLQVWFYFIIVVHSYHAELSNE
ncbi:uncharacterized protein [Battus philenor]|uniref:uncharacterized protein n=1 Tax=Battus philenor TaxID=42288 RepID=UPI0035CEF303